MQGLGVGVQKCGSIQCIRSLWRPSLRPGRCHDWARRLFRCGFRIFIYGLNGHGVSVPPLIDRHHQLA
jgi:hypothetical protein